MADGIWNAGTVAIRFKREALSVYNNASIMKKLPLKPNGRNIEISLELLELSLALQASIKKATKKK